MPKSKRPDRVDHQRAAKLLRDEWKAIAATAESKPAVSFVDDANLCDAIARSINHSQVSYRYCLPIQLLGKLTNPRIDSRRLQRGPNEPRSCCMGCAKLGIESYSSIYQGAGIGTRNVW